MQKKNWLPMILFGRSKAVSQHNYVGGICAWFLAGHIVKVPLNLTLSALSARVHCFHITCIYVQVTRGGVCAASGAGASPGATGETVGCHAAGEGRAAR